MNRVHQVYCLLILAFCGWVMYEAFEMTYYTALGPGPGFFPFWLAVFMAVLTALWFVQLRLHPVKGKARDFLPNFAGCWRVVSLIISTAVFAMLVEPVGFTITMFVFLLFLLIALGRQNVYVTLAVSLLGSFGIYYVFTEYLNVHLPASFIELYLRSLGL